MIQNILRDFNLFVDGRGYLGRCEEVSPPKLALKTEETRAGGMDAPVEVDLGMEKLECSFSLIGIDRDVLALWGVASGNRVPLVFRGALRSEDGSENAVVIEVRGLVREIDWGSWKPGDKAPLKATVACRYYKLTISGDTVHEIDIENGIRVVNGEDQLAERRKALGV